MFYALNFLILDITKDELNIVQNVFLITVKAVLFSNQKASSKLRKITTLSDCQLLQILLLLMWKRETTVEVIIGMLTAILKILLNYINIFIMKYYIKHIPPHFWNKLKYFAFCQQMKARLCSNITFYQVLIKIKFWLAITQVKVMMSYNRKFP